MLTIEQAQQAVADAATVYTVDGTGVVLISAGTDNDGIEYAAYLMADPDDLEPIRYTDDLVNLHARPQISVNIPAHPCNCEHTNHFDDEYGPRLEGAHVFLDVPAGDKCARYVGKICDACAETCMADYLI